MNKIFFDNIKTQKCPFRVRKIKYDGQEDEEMMPCDPNCMAFLCADDAAYICLRLVNINYKTNTLELFQGVNE